MPISATLHVSRPFTIARAPPSIRPLHGVNPRRFPYTIRRQAGTIPSGARRGGWGNDNGHGTGSAMWRMLRGLIYLAILGGIGLAGYAFVADLSPEQEEQRGTVVLDGR